MKKIKILLADDHDVVRNGIKLMLAQQKSFIPVFTEANDGEDVINKVAAEKFDIILLDINLPKKDGISVTKSLTAKYKDIKILALTMHKEDFVIKKMIDAGALGYLLKNTTIEELTKAIIAVSESKKYFTNEVAQVLLTGKLNNTHKNVPIELPAEFNSTLTKREKEILYLIASEFTSAEIAKNLFISKRTVDVHRNKILTKLNLKSTAAIVKYAMQNGMVK